MVAAKDIYFIIRIRLRCSLEFGLQIFEISKLRRYY
jgi:hypothetical protein